MKLVDVDVGPLCLECGSPATCIGKYEAMETWEYACDTCCGHGCEDGYCQQLRDEDGNPNPEADQYVAWRGKRLCPDCVNPYVDCTCDPKNVEIDDER